MRASRPLLEAGLGGRGLTQRGLLIAVPFEAARGAASGRDWSKPINCTRDAQRAAKAAPLGGGPDPSRLPGASAAGRKLRSPRAPGSARGLRAGRSRWARQGGRRLSRSVMAAVFGGVEG